MRAYKLFKKRKDGSLGPLFINASLRIPMGQWMPAEDHPTKGFAHRPGWHATLAPIAPHLKENPKGSLPRVWVEVDIEDYSKFERPQSQGGTWVLAQNMRVIRELTQSEVEQIREGIA